MENSTVTTGAGQLEATMTTVFKQLIFLLIVSLINVSVVALSVSAKKWLVRNIEIVQIMNLQYHRYLDQDVQY